MIKTGLSKAATKTMDQLVHNLEPGEHRKVHTCETFMAVHVERLTARTYSISHYFEQNGDLIADPDMEFWRADDGRFFPVAVQHAFGPYVPALVLNAQGIPTGASTTRMRELIHFANAWMQNIREQQSGWFAQSAARLAQ